MGNCQTCVKLVVVAVVVVVVVVVLGLFNLFGVSHDPNSCPPTVYLDGGDDDGEPRWM